jgi:activator of 2-hydroxyglutaryl-CoA dehydratase
MSSAVFEVKPYPEMRAEVDMDVPRFDKARDAHQSVVNRIVAIVSRVGYGEAIVFSGGVARNPCIVEMLRERLDNVRVDSPPAPDIVGALGAALYAAR